MRTGTGAESARQTGRRWWLLVTVGTGLLLVTLDNSILYTALPTLTRELGASASEGLWIINAYPLVMAGLLLGTGTLGDRAGHARMFLIGLAVFGAASAAAAVAPNPEVLIAARALLGVGAASMMPATLSLIRVTFTVERERNLAIAVWGSLAVVGAALGPIIGGVLLTHFWWGSVFLVNVPAAALTIIVFVLVAPPNDPDPAKTWDLLSSVLAMVGLVGLVLAIKESVRVDRSVTTIAIALAVGAVGVLLFGRRQRQLPHPLLDFAIFRNRAFMAGVLAAAMSLFAVAGLELLTTQRFQLVAGFTPLEAGVLVAAIAAGSLPSALLGGAFLHRTGLRPLITGGLTVAVVGVVVAVVGFEGPIGWLVGGLVLVGTGLGAAMSVASTAIMGNVDVGRAGMASSVEEVSYEFGSLTAVALLGSLVTAVYTGSVRFAEGTPGRASESIDQALAVAAGSEQGSAITAAAATAYDTGYVIVMIVAGGVLAVGAVVTGVLLRHHGPGTRTAANH